MALALRELNPAQGVSERHLVSAVRRGDDRAFELLFERYHRRIASYVYGLVRDAGRAEDITQEVFISAVRRLRATEQPIAFKPWIYEIAKNACIDEFRRTNRAAVVSLEEESDGVAPLAPLIDDRSPDVAWERRQEFHHFIAAFSGLSELHHRMLVMRELEGLSYAEIADRLSMSRTMVESTLFRARRRLSAEYEELASGRQCERVQSAIDGIVLTARRSPGIRERRRISAHLRHCPTCVRHARDAGLEESLLRMPSVAERIAAILPLGPVPAILRRLATRHGTTAASSAALADTSPVVAISRAVAAVAALAVAGVALPEITFATHHRSGTQAVTVPASVSLAPVPTQVGVPLNAAAAQGAEPARTLPVAVLANLDAFRAALRQEARYAAAERNRAGSSHHAQRGHGAKQTRFGAAALPGRSAGGAAKADGSTQAGTSAGAAGTSGGLGGVTGSHRHPIARVGTQATTGISGLVNTVAAAGRNTIAAAGGAVSQAGVTTGGAVTQTSTPATSAVTQTGTGPVNTVSQTSGSVGSTITQAGQTVGAAVSGTGAAAGAAVAGTGAAVGAVVTQTGQVAGAATSALSKQP